MMVDVGNNYSFLEDRMQLGNFDPVRITPWPRGIR